MIDAKDTTALKSSTILSRTDGGFIRPTAAERLAGRLMRAPDHSAADGGDAGAGGEAAGSSDAGAGDGGDAGATSAGADGGNQSAEGDDSTVLGSATADAGAGDDESKGGEGGENKADAEKGDAVAVPETYELKLTTTNEAGEETAVDLDPVLVETATPLLKDAGLTNDQANKLMPLVPKIQEQLFKKQNDDFAEVRANWAKEAEKDPEIGGKNWTETQRLAAKALDHYGAKSEIKEVDGKKQETNEFRKLLNESGLGSHPVMIRMFRAIGADLSEDGTFTRNTTEVKRELSREERNYPEDHPKAV